MPYSEPSESLVPSETDSVQIPLPKQKFKPKRPPRWPGILSAILLMAGGGWGWYWWQTTQAGKEPRGGNIAAAGQPMAMPVKLGVVETKKIQDTSLINGFLEAPRSIALKPEIDGRIKSILVKEGDRVKKGQVVIRLSNEEAAARVQQAKAALKLAEARLDELKAGTRPEEIAQAQAKLKQARSRLKNAKSGARPEEIAQAQAQIDIAKSDLQLAKSRAKRYKKLRQEGAISQDLLEGFIQEERSAEAKLKEVQRRLKELRKNRQSEIDELTAGVDLERQNLRLLRNGPRREEIAQARSQVQAAAAQVRLAKAQQEHTEIIAPLTGTVGDIPVKVGELVSQGDELTTINRNTSLELNLSVPFDKADKLRLGLPVKILDAGGKPAASGKVSFISPNIDINTQNILAKARFTNRKNQILNRLNVKAQVIWDEFSGIVIPTEAVSRMGGQTFVFVAQEQAATQAGMPTMRAQQKPVKLGAIQGNDYQVIEGLEDGEKIVISGIMNLSNGAPIRPLNADISPAK